MNRTDKNFSCYKNNEINNKSNNLIMQIKACFVVIFIICISFLVGCWDLEDIEDLALVANIAFDVGEFKEYKMTVQILLPQALGSSVTNQATEGVNPVFVIGAEGQTPYEANRKLREYIPKVPFYGNTMSVSIGEELAKQGVMPVLNLLESYHEFRRSKEIFLVLGPGGKVLETRVRVQENPGDVPMGFVQVLPGISTTVTQTVGDFISQAASSIIEPVMPVVKIIEDDPEIGENPGVRIARTGAFKGDKLVGFLDEEESRGLLWVLGRANGIINFKAPSTDKIVTIEISRSSSFMKAFIEDEGKLFVNIKIRTEGNLVDQTGHVDLNDPQIRRSIEKRYAETIRQDIISALNKAQKELKTDVFGFGGAFFRAYPRIWKYSLEPMWDDIYPYIPVNIYVEAHIRNTNLTMEAPIARR